jgi:hypothetical protein
MRRWIERVTIAAVVLGCVAMAPGRCRAAGEALKLLVRPGGAVGTDAPLCVEISLPPELAATPADAIRVELRAKDAAATPVPGQIVKTPDGRTQLWFILPAGQQAAEQRWTAAFSRGRPAEKTFAWTDAPGDHLDLALDGKPVTRCVYAYDAEKAKAVNVYKDTYKVFHHVFDAAGKNVITQGLGGKLYPHHRGLFIGFSRVRAGDLSGDWWHMTGGPQVHQKFLEQIAGPVLARSTALIHWQTKDGKLAVVEERTTTAYRQPAPALLLLDFRSRLTAPGKDVVLGGDPEHAGMQFRPHGDIDPKQTKYLFPKEDTNVQSERDLPWAAMAMVLSRDGGERYAVQHMSHPDNPKGTRYSAYRDYGRFGAFPTAEIKADQTLTLTYRIWAAAGELPARVQLQRQWEGFAHAASAQVEK